MSSLEQRALHLAREVCRHHRRLQALDSIMLDHIASCESVPPHLYRWQYKTEVKLQAALTHLRAALFPTHVKPET